MMYRNVRLIPSLSLILTLAMPLFGMDNLRHRVKNDSTETTVPYPIEFIPTPGRLFKKSWQQRIMICASLLVKCINNCCGCDEDNEHNLNTDYVPHRKETSATSLAVLTATQTAQVLLVPGTDDAFILNHYQEPKAILENAFANAPIKAKDLVDMLKYPTLYHQKVRFSVLYGPPGVAKSTLAKAIAYKAGWFVELITGRQVRAEHRGGSSIKLQKKFEDIVAKKINTVIVIDEINRLFENYNSTKHDTGDTAEDFWTFLDEQRRNRHLYIIGTANQIDKLPSQIRSRARNRFINISQSTTIEHTIKLFQQVFNEHKLSAACDSSFLIQFLTPLHDTGWNIRDFASLEESAVEIARRTDKLSPRLTITPAQLQEALKDIQRTDTDSKYGTEAESEEERHHKENLTQQKELHQDNMLVQKEHFVKGLFIQKAMQSNQFGMNGGVGVTLGATGPQFSGNLGGSVNNISWSDACITNSLSDEHIKLYREQQQAKEQRENGQARVNKLFKDIATKISALDRYKRKFLSMDSASSQCLIATIDKIIQDEKQLSDNFKGIQIPSQEELNNFTQKINTLNAAIDTLKPTIEACVGSSQKSTRSGWFG